MAAPTQTFAYADHLYHYKAANNTPTNMYFVTYDFANTYTVQDYADANTADDTTQLGDIANDHFNITAPTSTGTRTAVLVYKGQTADGIIAEKGANYFLLTNKYIEPAPIMNNYYYPTTADMQTSDQDATPYALCFASGTRIRTARGDIPVEALKVGDIAVTASGAYRPITWLGHREVECAALDAPHESWPVRVRAGAFGVGPCGGNLPERDLRLSPGHPVLVGSGANEHLVPIMCLINGTTIDRVEVPSITYWHVELDAHDILLAEGLPAESFLDYGTRPWFGPDAEAHALANPDHVVPGLGARCRPVAIDGQVVEAERRRLDAVFTMSLAAASAWPTWNATALGF